MKKRFGIVILSVFILMVFACCSLSSQSVVPTVPDYATITAEAPEGYEEYFTSSRGQHCLGTTYCNEDKTLFQGYFYALRPLGQYHTGIQGPEDEAVIVKGTYAYNVDDEKIGTLKISIETKKCELKDPVLSCKGSEKTYPLTLSQDGTVEMKLDSPIGEGDVFMRLRGTLVYDGAEYQYDQQI